MAGFKVRPATLSGVSANIKECARAYEGAVVKAKAATDALTAQWEGEAREAFVREQEQVVEWYHKMVELADIVAQALSSAAASYETVDTDAEARMRRVLS